ncbi:MAG: mercury(II) reductase [Thaumarchaeota archaeon]|nr:mercury(II) reductase [Nitrososphaerota archaeon]
MVDYDLVVLGGGAAAFAAALKAAEMDSKVAMVESGTIGGTCVNVGCVPTKNLLSIGEIIHECVAKSNSQSFSNPEFDFDDLINKKDELVQKLRNQKYTDVIKSMPNTEFIKGHAKIRSSNEVSVDDRILKGRYIVIATGSSPSVPPIHGIENVDYLTNVEALSLSKKPDSMIIIGGRALGLEFAQMYARFGTKVTVLQRSQRIIPEEEPEISDILRTYLEEEGIEIRTEANPTKMRKEGRDKVVFLDGEDEIRAEEILLATGRRPNTSSLGLESAGIGVRSDGAIIVDDEMRTNIPNIFAAGDVIGKPMLETAAAKEGSVAASNALFGTHKKMDFNTVPHAIFTSPQVASIGITEREYREKYGVCSCKSLLMSDVSKAVIVNKTKGIIKMVVEPKTGRIIGVHILSDLAADIIHEAVLAVKHRLTVDDIIDTVHVFPTMSESIKLVATSFKKNVKQLSCCAE